MNGTRQHASHNMREQTSGASSCSACGSLPVSIPNDMYSLPISALGLSTRLLLIFERTGISTIGQLREMELVELRQLKLDDKSITELIERVQALNLLPYDHHQGGGEEPLPTGRRDKRQRPGRGRLRGVAPHQLQLREQCFSSGALLCYCYKVPVAWLPLVLRLQLPRWARCGIEQSEDNNTTREELLRRTRYCYVQPFILGEQDKLVEWQPGLAGDVPNYYRVGATPDALRAARFIEVDARSAQVFVGELMNAAAPSPLIRVAPACFLKEEMRAMIAPGVSFPDELTAPSSTSQRRVSLARGNQAAIPQQLATMRIEDLTLTERTLTCLLHAGVTTVGVLLELEEERLVEFLDQESLQELYTAVFAKGVLPTPTGILPAEQTDEEAAPAPIFEPFYYYPTGTTYDDEQLGRLYLVHAAVLRERLDGSRSGPVETLWLTRKQLGQSLIWERELEGLDSLELWMRVTTHAIARGAVIPRVVPADEAASERNRREREMEERYNLVPFRHELFVSNADLATENARGYSPTTIALHMLDRYINHPELQPVEYRLPRRLLEEMEYWIREDRKRQYEELPSPATPTIVMHEVCIQRKRRVRATTGKLTIHEVTEPIGYYLIIGVLATTPVKSDLITQPRRGKPQFAEPSRPIKPIRTPNYVLIQDAA